MNRRFESRSSDDSDDSQMTAPTMNRSRNQLATAYGPGAFFTFEGGLGACISIPDQSTEPDIADISDATKTQILLRLREIWNSWFTRAHALDSPQRRIEAKQCIDEALLRSGLLTPLNGADLTFVNPIRMGYAPAPLTFVCNRCSRFVRYEKPDDILHPQKGLRSFKCQKPGSRHACQWRQLDVIFVHWSGEWMPATPGRWEWGDRQKSAWLSGESCPICKGFEVNLRSSSPRIGEWHFYCASATCGHKFGDEWRQNDKFITELYEDQAGRRNAERRMEPISYRASSAYYSQSDQFVLFEEKDQGLLALLEPQNSTALGYLIGTKYGFKSVGQSDDEMRDALLASGNKAEWESYETLLKLRVMVAQANDLAVVASVDAELTKLKDRWAKSDPPLIEQKVELPTRMASDILMRTEYSSRFDPYVLAVEHEALKRGKLSVAATDGRAPFVRFEHLDNDLSPKTIEEKLQQEAETAELKSRLGIAEIGLIREFNLCRFTHGFTRVSSAPTIEKHGMDMPVRLKLFEPLRNGRRPIYVVTQGNEAIYVQLDAVQVHRWLAAVGVTDLPDWRPSDEVSLGGRILETAEPFGRYFSRLKEDDASTYRYVYTLIHSMAHSFIKNISEVSGLDLGSMGEYLFPADLAFVVYRNGTTMDLGNLSSLWRNENNRFLRRFLEPSTYRCNSGSLCDAGGGACPDCIMIPETSCVAQNRLLSRAVARGGHAPREDRTHRGERVRGFLEVVNESPSR